MVAFGNEKLSQPKEKNPPKNPTPEQERTWRNRVRRNHFVNVTPEFLAEEDVAEAATTVPGTRKIHAQNTVGEEGMGLFKDLLCPCPSCRHGKSTPCMNQDLQEDWRRVVMARKTVAEPRNLRVPHEDYVDRLVMKEFDGEYYKGKVTEYEDAYFHIVYDDGDEEDLTFNELLSVLVPVDGDPEVSPVRYGLREDVMDALRSGMDVAFQNYVDMNCEYYICRLAGTEGSMEECWYTVPHDETLTVHYFDKDGEYYSYGPGKKLLKCYMWFRRNIRDRKYELIDDEFVNKTTQKNLDKTKTENWESFPLTYFDPDTLLHCNVSMVPVQADTARKGVWAYLDKEDEIEIESHVWGEDD